MHGKKILVVDDEQDLREALQNVLNASGFMTITAPHGEAGLALALSEKPDLILLDIGMPKMNGHQVLAQLRKDAWGKHVPVFLLTNYEDAGNVAEGLELKGDEYIMKSNESLESIVKRVKQYLAGYHE